MQILKQLNFVLFFTIILLCLILKTDASEAQSVDVLEKDGRENFNVDQVPTLGVSSNDHAFVSVATPDLSFKAQRRENEVIKLYSNEWWVAVYGTLNGVSKPMIVLGTFMILGGLYLCSMGYKYIDPMLGVMGYLTFGTIMWIALANCKPDEGYPNDTVVMITVPMCIGIIGAIVYYFFAKYSTYFSAGLGGFALALFICSWRYDFVIKNLVGRLSFLGGMAVVSGISIRFLPRDITLFKTSFVGSYITMLGIDCLARKGYIAGFESLVNNNPNSQVEYTVSGSVYIFLAMTLVLFFISFGWQYYFNIIMPTLRKPKKPADQQQAIAMQRAADLQNYQAQIQAQNTQSSNENVDACCPTCQRP